MCFSNSLFHSSINPFNLFVPVVFMFYVSVVYSLISFPLPPSFPCSTTASHAPAVTSATLFCPRSKHRCSPRSPRRCSAAIFRLNVFCNCISRSDSITPTPPRHFPPLYSLASYHRLNPLNCRRLGSRPRLLLLKPRATLLGNRTDAWPPASCNCRPVIPSASHLDVPHHSPSPAAFHRSFSPRPAAGNSALAAGR